MTDDKTKPPSIVPFGKFKGRLIEEMLDNADFLSWAQWALGQAGIRERYPAFCQVIINRGSEPEETPDHNAMQVKFLDDDYCLRFVRVCDICDIDEIARDELQGKLDWRTKNIEMKLEQLRGDARHEQSRIEHAEKYERGQAEGLHRASIRAPPNKKPRRQASGAAEVAG